MDGVFSASQLGSQFEWNKKSYSTDLELGQREVFLSFKTYYVNFGVKVTAIQVLCMFHSHASYIYLTVEVKGIKKEQLIA